MARQSVMQDLKRARKGLRETECRENVYVECRHFGPILTINILFCSHYEVIFRKYALYLTHMYVCVYIYVCVCVCMCELSCVCVRPSALLRLVV